MKIKVPRIFNLMIFYAAGSFFCLPCSAQVSQNILPGAYQTNQYISIIKNKRVAIFANHTSLINKTHLVDSLLKLGIKITKVFAPEHGFRGRADAGEKVSNSKDSATGLSIISLYGSKRKLNAIDVIDVDILLFDIQDVGVRFYTYISSLQEFIEAAIENDKPLIILDRPNPNGFYVDGPTLDSSYKSFIGMQPVPVVYGMTIGEYAKMLIGEKWLNWKYVREIDNKISLGEMLGFELPRKNFSLTVIPCKNYTHKSKYVLPVAPSPNLPTMSSIYWYPSTCFFEGTVLSEGRGTDKPFSYFGHPKLPKDLFAFTPTSRIGAKEPKFKNEVCYGWNVSSLQHGSSLQLQYLLNAYQVFQDKDKFFIHPKSLKPQDYFFNKLAGSNTLLNQIIERKTEKEIKQVWQPAIQAFKKIRKKYLLYPDFE